MIRHQKYVGMVLIAALLCTLFSLPVSPLQAAGTERKAVTIQRTKAAPQLDGKTNESIWSIGNPLTVRTGNGDFQDASFGMLWDHKYLYIAVNIKDDRLIHDGTGSWFEQDHIGLFFDPKGHRSAPVVESDMQVGLVYKPDGMTPAFHFGAAPNHASKDEKKILRAIQTTADGWSAEVAVPWDMLQFDPLLSKQFGFEIGVTDRDDPTATARSSYWSAYQSDSYWNDTSGYGTVTLSDSVATGSVSTVLLEENFDTVEVGNQPYGWISDVNAGSSPMTVTKDAYGNGRLTFDGNAAGKQARITAPVQWDNYTIEADLRFEGVLNGARWAALIFRVPSNGKHPYNQMAVRQNGAFEMAYRKPDNSWSVPAAGTWQPLLMQKDYTLKLRVFDNNVKEYIKTKDAPGFSLLMDKSFSSDMLERGKIGFQADQSKVSFDNLKVTRISAEALNMNLPATAEALAGPVSVSQSVYFSDGITETVPVERVKLHSSDESIVKIIDNKPYPLKAGKAALTAVYDRVVAKQELTVTPSTTAPSIVSLKHDMGYTLAVSGQAIDLSTLTFSAEYNDFTSRQVKGNELSWSSASEGIAVENGKLAVKQKGIHTVTAKSGTASYSLLIVAKNPADLEYVLYEENFDTLKDGALPQGWARIQGSTANAAAVKAGAFEMDARTAPDNPSRVLFPDYLGLFGNYKIEADMTHLAANNTARWNSIMYRIQNHNYPYYQMAVRQGATAANGVEFAERTPANAWNVPEKASFTEAIDPAQMYRYTVKTFGNRVQHWIGDNLLIDTDLADAYSKGRIGLQADGSKMKVDNVRITLQETPLPPLPADRFVNVIEPETDIAMAPTIVTEPHTLGDMEALTGNKLPATVILHLNSRLELTDPTYKRVTGTLEEAIRRLSGPMMPAFYVKDKETVDVLIAYLKKDGLEDAFVVSDNVKLVRQARLAYPLLRGIVDFRDGKKGKSHEDLMEIRRMTNEGLSKIALLPQAAATLENTAYLQKRLITVWAADKNAGNVRQSDLHHLITAGVNGIVTSSPAAAIDALKVYAGGTVLIRKPWVIGHRGIPSLAPENTMEGYKLAYEKGADILETDIYLSKDGHIVIMHDPTLDRTTTGTGLVEDYTLEQLKSFKANDQFPAQYPEAGIPTLAEMFDEFKGKDVVHFVEIKSYKPEIIDALVSLIKEKGVEDQVAVISFSADQLKLLGQKMPGMSAGFLTSGYANETRINKSLRDTLRVIQPISTTFNTSYDKLGPKFMEAAKHRGITVWPWTYRNQADFASYFHYGTHGLTTDYAQWASNMADSLTAEKHRYELKRGDEIAMTADLHTYAGSVSKVSPEIVLLEGQEALEVNRNHVKGKQKGDALILLRYTVTSGTGTYTLYSQPIVVEVK